MSIPFPVDGGSAINGGHAVQIPETLKRSADEVLPRIVELRHAIHRNPELALEEKQQTPIGLARIDRDRCLPWAYDIPCIVCEEACPIADKAIELDVIEIVDAQGEAVLLQRPRVVKELCIGCGICEYQCPMGGEAAVRVYTWTEASPYGVSIGG